MERKLVQTKDHSPTLYVAQLDEHYHSIHGALQESRHVFLRAGLDKLDFQQELSILEFGFGTGLNALLTAQAAQEKGMQIDYHGLEKYPLAEEEWRSLRYDQDHGVLNAKELFQSLHQCGWEEWQRINKHFRLYKEQVDFRAATLPPAYYHLVYFDAFAPSAQPELWTSALFSRIFESMQEDGVLVTYCVKGWVRRNMMAAGFKVEKIPGPPGKREMARAFKK